MELKSCPFCGQPVVADFWIKGHFIKIKQRHNFDCPLENQLILSRNYATREQAIKAWNTRKEN
jgi:hypothetical protein